MKRLSNQRGGILLKLFFIIFFVAAGAAGWFYWKHRRMPSIQELKKTESAATREVARLADRIGGQNESGPVTKDSRGLCAWVQSKARESLVKQGLKEADVLKSFNAERQKDGVLWIEHTLEVRRPAGFRPAVFRRDIEHLAKSKGLVLLRDDKTPDLWTIEVGYKDRIFERLILRS